MMQGIMWIILGATVGLAALVSYERRSSIDVKLDGPKDFRGVSVQLPKGWEVSKKTDPLSSVLLTATESKKDEDDGSSGRVIRIVREPIPSNRSPIEFAALRLGNGGSGSATVKGKNYITIDRSPGEILYQIREVAPKSLRDAMAGETRLTEVVCAATMTPSGRGFAVELEGEDAENLIQDIDLVKRIAGTVKLSDEPPLIDSGEVTLDNQIHVPLPPDFKTAKHDGPLDPQRIFRSQSASGAMKTIALLPVVMLPKDGTASILTMLSMCAGDFEDAQVRQDPSGAWRADVDATVRQYFPLRAFAYGKNGAGVLAIFRGGEDDSWIDPTWDALRQKLSFPADSNLTELISNGTAATKKLQQAGLSDYLPNQTEDAWWILCLNGPENALGWWKYTASARRQSYEQRVQFENRLHEISYDFSGPSDLSAYRVQVTYSISDLRAKQSTQNAISFDANLKSGHVELKPGGSKSITLPAPPNYIPGGWLPLILPKLVDRPMIIRADSFIDYAYAQPRDFLTATLRPEPDAQRSINDSQDKLRCISVQFNGAPERALWFFREDGTLDGVDYPQAQHLIRSDEHDVTQAFAHKEALRP
jgi:hypothetical protein